MRIADIFRSGRCCSSEGGPQRRASRAHRPWLLLGIGLAASLPGHGAEAPDLGCALEVVYESFAGLILVPITVDGSPIMDFVLDTGASTSSLTDPYLANALGLGVREAGLARGMGVGAKQVFITEEATLSSQGFEFLTTPLAIHDIGVLLSEMSGRDLHGFLGSGLLGHYVVEIDPRGRRLVLHDPDEFLYRGPGSELPLELVAGRPVVEARAVIREGRKPVPVRLLVDTGSSRLLTLVAGSRRQLRTPPDTTVERGVGVVGRIDVEVAPIARLDLAAFTILGIETAWVESYRVPAVQSIPGLNGILGNALLGRFRAIFDAPRGRLILEPLDGS